MSSGTTAIVVVIVVVIIVALAAVAMNARRRKLQRQFGPEYDLAVAEQNSKLRADAALADRQRRVRKLDIKPLSDEARARYSADWMVIQEQFVDSPQSAVSDAYALVTTVMTERGYPTEDDEQVMADLSVEHAATVGHFRSARAITMNAASGDAMTEDLRQAVIHYRALFSDLLGSPVAPVTAGDEVAMAEPVRADAPADASTPAADETAAPVAPNGVSNGRVTEPAADTDPDGRMLDEPAADEADASQRY
jgi:hypothetical protein